MSKTSKIPKHDPYAGREAQRYEKPIASREYILELIDVHGAPCTQERLEQLLELETDDELEALRRRLKAMVRDGQLVLNRREGYLPVNERDLIRGRVIAHPDGFGFLHPDEGGDDLFIPPNQMRSLLHGDRAVVRVVGMDRRGRREVALIEVLERANKQVVGRLHFEGKAAFVVADHKRIVQDIVIPAEDLGQARKGQIVVAEIVKQPTPHHPPIGRIAEVLGDHMDPGMEIEISIASHDIPNTWPEAVLEQAGALGAEVREADKRDRLDLRDKPLVTIDGEDAEDFDDAVYCERTIRGWRLYVAIADVAHYVEQDAPLDQEAVKRSTSVYFPGRVVPMLPEALSNGLCSLNPHVDRLCMVCIMDFDRGGRLKKWRFHEAVMHSRARLTYTQVADALIERDPAVREQLGEVLPHLETLHNLFKARDSRRKKRGAIDFDTTETRIVFDKDGKIDNIVPVERNDAHRLIEECMIAANIATARFLAEHKIPCLFRVHGPPPADKVEDLAKFLGEIGLKFPARKTVKPKQLADVLHAARGRPDEHLIQTVVLRSLSQAEYKPENGGHFGLALEAYTHFTSPIRRYPDLLVHRAIRHVLRGGSADNFSYTLEAMRELGSHASMAERRADEATRDAVEWLKCEYLQNRVGETFDGIITGVTGFGVFVEMQNFYVEGLVHITSLPKDFYHFDPVAHKLTGERSGRVFQLAGRVRVQLNRVSLDDRKIDLTVAEPEESGKQRGKRRRKRRSRGS